MYCELCYLLHGTVYHITHHKVQYSVQILLNKPNTYVSYGSPIVIMPFFVSVGCTCFCLNHSGVGGGPLYRKTQLAFSAKNQWKHRVPTPTATRRASRPTLPLVHSTASAFLPINIFLTREKCPTVVV